MKLVVDAGPIIALAKVNRLMVMESMFDETWIPDVVMHEVLAKPGNETRRIDEAIRRFIRVSAQPTVLAPHLEVFARGLDEGEKSVIALAGALPPPVSVLMDDAAGRAVAKRCGIGVLGFAGLLIKARERGLVDRVVPLMLDAREHGYWLDDALIETVRRLTGE
jgi:predicted nucleic acid-binding protein